MSDASGTWRQSASKSASSVTDPNGVQTITSYDALNRVTEVRRKGATPAADLVTTYSYNSFGDLFCTQLPRGNGMEYVYDSPGRLKEIRRGTTIATPTSANCLDAAQPRERSAYQLDGSGNRVEESLERWTPTTLRPPTRIPRSSTNTTN